MCSSCPCLVLVLSTDLNLPFVRSCVSCRRAFLMWLHGEQRALSFPLSWWLSRRSRGYVWLGCFPSHWAWGWLGEHRGAWEQLAQNAKDVGGRRSSWN